MKFEDPVVDADVIGLDQVPNTRKQFQNHFG
jgi:hypothetical protein